MSRKGFTDQALRLAKHEGIGCLSLLPHDPNQIGFGVGDMWYGRQYKWGESYITVYLADVTAKLPDHFESPSIKWSGQPIIEWFKKEFYTTYRLEKQTGDHTLKVQFDCTRSIAIEGEEYDVKGLALTVKRLCQPKKQWVTWSGDAFYDWQSGSFTVPPQGILIGSRIDTTLIDWDDFDGVIPEAGKGEPLGFLRMILDCFEFQKLPDKVVNLDSIIACRSFYVGLPSETKGTDAK